MREVPTTSGHPKQHFDYIVVGGGSAGCVTAGRLVGEHDARVLMLEAGRSNESWLIRMPAGSIKLLSGETGHVRHYVSAKQASLNSRAIIIPQASVLGGGSSVNMMTYLRGHSSDYDCWDQQLGGASSWSWRHILPYFRRQENNQRLNSEIHGIDGPMFVSDIPYKCEISHLFVKTLQSSGLPYLDDFNSNMPRGVGYAQITSRNGRRCSAADAYLTPLRNDSRLTIKTGARVTRILFHQSRAIGVEYLQNGQLNTCYADNEIVLTAGALETPKLLMLSGIGPSDDLTRLSIDVRVDLPGVGRNLQDHNACAITAYTDGNYGYFGHDRGWRMIANALQYLLFNSGPVTSNGGEAMALVNLEDVEKPANLQLYALGIMWAVPGAPPPAPGLTLMANLIRPYSRGSVRLQSSDPLVDPEIDFNWFSDERDLRSMIRGIRFLREMLRTDPLSRVVREECLPGSSVQTDDEIGRYAKSVTETNFHPVGTCRMGRDDDPMAVATPDLRVRGVEGLRVLDASMMPVIPAANTNATVMAVADKGVDMMLGKPAPQADRV